MLLPGSAAVLSDFDRLVFDTVVPADHYLRQVATHIDFERFRPRLAEAYHAGMGRPAIDPVRMLKILFLRFHYKLSDRQVMARIQTDMAFRWFLDLALRDDVPHPTEGTYFRKRIGVERFLQVFQELISQAREAGLVKDRLRLKDATHLFADAAEVQPLALAAQVRERLLQAAQPLWPEWVEAQHLQMERLRQTTAESSADERLAARVEHLRDAAAQLRQRLAQLAPDAAAEPVPQRLGRTLELVDKLLADRDDPEAGDRLASAVDPDARRGRHGGFFLGYLLDLAIDADSELITSLNVLPGNGAEAAEATDAVTLVQQEEAAQGNDVAGLSMDGVGYHGPVLRQLTDPHGLNIDVTVPVPTVPPRTTFGPERFTLRIIDSQHGELTCPHGQTTRQRTRNRHGTGYRYQFKAQQCAGCPLRNACLNKPSRSQGRIVVKNDYEAEYAQAAAKVGTAAYQQTRRTHAKVERKLGEVVRHQQGRRARFRGLPKVLLQSALTALVVNVKRMVKLLRPPQSAPATSACPQLAPT